MTITEEVSRMLENGNTDDVITYARKNYEQLECEMKGVKYEEPQKGNISMCEDCNIEMIVEYKEAILACPNCGLCEDYPIYETSYAHPMKKRKRCIYKRDDNFKVILDQFLCRGKQNVSNNVINILKEKVHNYTIPLTIPILECLLKEHRLMKYKKSIYYIFFKLTNQPVPYITPKEYDKIHRLFKIANDIYEQNHKPIDRKSFLNYPFVLKKIFIILWKADYANYIQPLKTHSKQKELE